MMSVFKNDTPVVMMENGREQEVREFMVKLYKDETIVDQRVEELRANLSGSQM